MNLDLTSPSRMFIISSKEGEIVAKALKEALSIKDLEIHLWSHPEIFALSRTSIESLEEPLGQTDFAVTIISPDDAIKFKDKKATVPRDNVIFELGLFMGRFGRFRVFMVKPAGIDIKLPSDLSGVTYAEYFAEKHGSIVRYNFRDTLRKIRHGIKKAPLTITDVILFNTIFPSNVLKYCLAVFHEFPKNPNELLPFTFDAQVTVLDRAGRIYKHTSASALSEDARIHEGRVIWTSFKTDIKDRPFEAIVESSADCGWVLWADSGYSLLYLPIRSRSNHRVCTGYFEKKDEQIYVLEIHQELAAEMEFEALRRLARIIPDRIREVEKEMAKVSRT